MRFHGHPAKEDNMCRVREWLTSYQFNEILAMTAQHTATLSPPPLIKLGVWPLLAVPTHDRGKYCWYHQRSRHFTDECLILQNEIENIIQRD